MTQIVLQIPETVTLVAIVLMPIAKVRDQKPTFDAEGEPAAEEQERKSA